MRHGYDPYATRHYVHACPNGTSLCQKIESSRLVTTRESVTCLTCIKALEMIIREQIGILSANQLEAVEAITREFSGK